MTSLYYDMQGRPISLEELVTSFSSKDRIICQTEGRLFFISTVWLGLDHNFAVHGPPLIFETMVFGQRDWKDLDMRRYSTLAEAKGGHLDMVYKWTGWRGLLRWIRIKLAWRN